MKYLLPLLLIFLLACKNRKIEPEVVASDTIKVATDSTQVEEEIIPLAFSPIEGFSLRKNSPLPDSVSVLLITGQDEFNKWFEGKSTAPDYIINYTLAIASQPTDRKTTIEVEKVEIKGSLANVYVKVSRGEKEKTTSSPARLFAIEKRSGVISMDVYVNGKLKSGLMVAGV